LGSGAPKCGPCRICRIERVRLCDCDQALQFLDTGAVERLLAQIRPGAFVTLFEVAKPDVMSQTRAKTKHRSTNVLHFHPYLAIAADLGFHVLTCRFVEQTRVTSPKLKLLLTAQPSSS
jgi:hypothetical protein